MSTTQPTREQDRCPCCTCGAQQTGGIGSDDWFVCWRCNLQGVEHPPLPEHVMKRAMDAMAAARARELGPAYHVTWTESDEGKANRQRWQDTIAREGNTAAAIRAIHDDKIANGQARPLTELLDAGEAAKMFGVTRPTFRKWVKTGKVDLTQIEPTGGGTLFREDELVALKAARA
jgi:Helix-turn-helix domain